MSCDTYAFKKLIVKIKAILKKSDLRVQPYIFQHLESYDKQY